MIQHLFKLIWKRRKSNFLIMLEIFFAFIIVFAVGSLCTYYYRGYVKPLGIKNDNVWAVFVDFNTENDSIRNISNDLLRQKIQSYREVKTFSFSHSNVPYSFSSSGTQMDYKGKKVQTEIMYVEETYPSVLGLEMVAGTWFKNTDTIQKAQPVVVTQTLKEELFGNEDALGKILGSDDKNHSRKIIGVIGGFKHKGDFQIDDNCVFQAIGKGRGDVLVKTAPSPKESGSATLSADFEAQFAADIQNLGKDWSVEIQHLDEMKTTRNKLVYIPLIMVFIVVGFLIANVALGLFGVLFQNINRRRGEIGLRRAMGATGRNITSQFIGEMTVLATFAIAVGAFFAVQFPILRVFDLAPTVYLWGIFIAIIAVYGLVLICSWIPSRQAAAVNPATALHEE